MKQLKCEMCGSTDLIKQEGVFVCQGCGCKYSIEEAKKMMAEESADVLESKTKVETTEKSKSLSEPAKNANKNKVKTKNKAKAIKRKIDTGLIKTLVTIFAILGIVGALFGFLIWPQLIYPNLPNDDFYTPEIIQTYCDSNLIITITDCTQEGAVSAICESIQNGVYSKSILQGKIIEKKNNGDVVIEWTEQVPEFFSGSDPYMLPTSTMSIKKEWKKLQFGSLTLDADSSDTHNISTIEDLNKLSNSYDLFVLNNDIDLAGVSWNPIQSFSGVLIGNGYSIKNLKIDSSSDNVGFFSSLSGIVTNLKIEDASVSVSGKHENVGILCGLQKSGNLINVTTSGTISAPECSNVGGVVGKIERDNSITINSIKNTADVSGNEYVGGIFGHIKGSTYASQDYAVNLSDLSNSGNITGSGNYVGGIMGYYYTSNSRAFPLYSSDLENTGDISGKGYVGGLFGYAYSNGRASYLQNSKSSASISAEYMVGGLAGKLENVALIRCDNEGSTVTATKYMLNGTHKQAYVGGYAGYGFVAMECTNTVDINYTAGGSYVGGIIGYASIGATNDISTLKNTGKISGADYTGGIIGYASVDVTVSVNSVTNESTVSGNEYVGGIFGCMKGEPSAFGGCAVNLSALGNSGDVSGSGNYIGGIIGYYYTKGGYGDFTLYSSGLENTGDISGKGYVGGLFGYAYSDVGASYIQNSKSSADISAEYMVGGLAGQLENVQLNNCENTDSTLTANNFELIGGKKYAYVGGFVGKSYLVNNCTNTININYTGSGMYVGGISGYIDVGDSVDMSNLHNQANVSGNEYVGGIFGCIKGEPSAFGGCAVNLSALGNSGDVSGSGNYVGGIIGYYYTRGGYGDFLLYGSGLENTGKIKGNAYVGGLFGYAYSNGTASCVQNSRSTGPVIGVVYYGRFFGDFENITLM